MNPMVEFCITNLANGAQAAYDILENDPNIDVLEYGCLSFCMECAEGLYAVVNGDLVTGDDADALVKNIYQYIEDNPMW